MRKFLRFQSLLATPDAAAWDLRPEAAVKTGRPLSKVPPRASKGLKWHRRPLRAPGSLAKRGSFRACPQALPALAAAV